MKDSKKTYKELKIEMLEKDFRIHLSFEEIEAIKNAKSDYAVDRVAHDLLIKHL